MSRRPRVSQCSRRTGVASPADRLTHSATRRTKRSADCVAAGGCRRHLPPKAEDAALPLSHAFRPVKWDVLDERSVVFLRKIVGYSQWQSMQGVRDMGSRDEIAQFRVEQASVVRSLDITDWITARALRLHDHICT